jgi:hypothetical protein
MNLKKLSLRFPKVNRRLIVVVISIIIIIIVASIGISINIVSSDEEPIAVISLPNNITRMYEPIMFSADDSKG